VPHVTRTSGRNVLKYLQDYPVEQRQTPIFPLISKGRTDNIKMVLKFYKILYQNFKNAGVPTSLRPVIQEDSWRFFFVSVLRACPSKRF
jgi:hypothetical protein